MNPDASPLAQAPLLRREDERLLRGQGQFVHNLRLPGMRHVAFARSSRADARLSAIDSQAALASAGVLAIYSAASASTNPQVCDKTLGQLRLPPPNPLLNALLPDVAAPAFTLLPLEHAAYVGQALALVVADSAAAAHSAAQAVLVDYAPIPVGEAALPAAAQITIGAPLDAAPAGARRVQVSLSQARVAALALEPRAAVAHWDASARTLTLWLGTQAVSRARDDVAQLLGLAREQVRVIAPDVGGAFGAKASLTPEEFALAWAALQHPYPLRWVATRSEEFCAAFHGRGARLQGALVCSAEGQLLQLEASLDFPLGAWLPYSAVVPLRNAARILPGPYQVPQVYVTGRAQLQPLAPVNIYRGAGRPEAAILMERLIDAAARACGLDPVQLRLANVVGAQQMPWTLPSGDQLDSGDYAQALQRACALINYPQARADQARRRAAGERVGLGVALYVEPCGQGWESARLTWGADGRVLLASGSSAQGQGHETSFAVIAAQALGLAPEFIDVVHGDSATCPEGIGALASRSMAIGGSAVLAAAQQLRARREAGEPLPLTVSLRYQAPAEAWGYGCVIAQMAVDNESGEPTIEKLVWVDDAGHIISPALAHGQLMGGLAQGLGQAMMERLVYSDDAQLLSGSLMDYALPRASDIPPVQIESLHCPSHANVLGAKGVGEAGCIGVPAALLNAACDALYDCDPSALQLPLSAETLWRALQQPHAPLAL